MCDACTKTVCTEHKQVGEKHIECMFCRHINIHWAHPTPFETIKKNRAPPKARRYLVFTTEEDSDSVEMAPHPTSPSLAPYNISTDDDEGYLTPDNLPPTPTLD